MLVFFLPLSYAHVFIYSLRIICNLLRLLSLNIPDLNKRNSFFSQSWRLKVQDQGFSLLDFWWELCFLLADGCLLCPHITFNWCMLRERGERKSSLKSLIRTLILLDQVPTVMISFNFNYFLCGSVFKYSHTGLYGFSTWIWVELGTDTTFSL